MQAQNIDSTIGLDANVGGDEAVNETVEKSQEVRTGTSLGNTLFGMYNVLADGLSDLVNVIFPGLAMLDRAGVPTWITSGILAPFFSFIIAIDFISFLKGYGL